MLLYKTSLGKFKKIYQVSFPTTMLGDEKSTKRKILQKNTNMWRLKNKNTSLKKSKKKFFF